MLPLHDLPEFAYDFQSLRDSYLADEALLVSAIYGNAGLNTAQRARVNLLANQLINHARDGHHPLFNEFLQQYRLDSKEGRILLTLAEALLRIPDSVNRNALIHSLLPTADWSLDEDNSGMTLVWANKALNLARRFIQEENFPDAWHQLLLKLGDSVIRPALSTGIHLIAKQFVMAETIPEALALRQPDFRYSFDCLGEAAQTDADAKQYWQQYQSALEYLATHQRTDTLIHRDSISIKLSALHPRYEAKNWAELQQQLVPQLLKLVQFAAEAGIPITFDAEESERLELSLALYADIVQRPEFKHYHGLGIAVQAYQKRAPAVIDWLIKLSHQTGQRLAIRLVKGAYWDYEIKRSQQLGLSDYPVFTRKLHTDICYLHCARQLLKHSTHIWPQFATHNAHTLAWLDIVAQDLDRDYEVQHLVGMGDNIHQAFGEACHRPTRIYAPIGRFDTLLPYLVRRLLENGSSQSFVNQLANHHITSEQLTKDPVTRLAEGKIAPHPKLAKPSDLFLPRPSSVGISPADMNGLAELREQLIRFHHQTWTAGQYPSTGHLLGETRHSPVDKHRILGTVHAHSAHDVDNAYVVAEKAFQHWRCYPVTSRADCLRMMAEQLQQYQAELLYLLMMEAGKILEDALGEWREAIDLCYFYAQEAERLQQTHQLPHISGEANYLQLMPRGIFACISPWNFPLAIFIGQIAAALVTGNAVIAKPAHQTPFIAQRCVELWQHSGLPQGLLQLLFGSSQELSAPLLQHPLLAGVVFTGSTHSAQAINQALAHRQAAILPLIAETGGINAMIADSSALVEQVIQDAVNSAFNSAGQRCSALRVLWLQKEIADHVLKGIEGVLNTWRIGHSCRFRHDMSAVIDAQSQAHLQHYCQHLMSVAHRHFKATLSPACVKGYYVAPQVFVIDREHLPYQEVFGPILHVVTWKQNELAEVVQHINRTGYGLTLAMHSRISAHLDYVQRHIKVGNFYINRHQIGAQVGCQPFGGEGLSGTGFKAGGSHYLLRFCHERVVSDNLTAIGANNDLLQLDD
ncbi:bifunctional proline dehydrogenase/L-glutamate gamma-semialdehyde dehydrogenase PutA [Agitococcus lubricus]|uniref:Bifunctional protein PutA n=1 Tax=Agitococcus lubricus TaxID=1077255 RepID=A0A2T5IZ40_9GAMM|nr:bifunctional proline dehydrogenase/L-glutamate gamma-semialdehyde dehydrogenase PutA [Agitococcus lubricus]PTQ89308.1 L-proline dehydrogenase /delta-1-pyrroline-5-carboxylate dehydrogenase [Agitococcus lubricus]